MAAPSTGNVKAFVVPVVFSDFTYVIQNNTRYQNRVKNEINTTFFGDGETDTGYWESLASYYSESSYGKLNITGTVSDFLYFSNSAEEIKKMSSTTSVTTQIVDYATETFFDSGDYKISDYDSDGDGYIDLFWLVYMYPYDSSYDSFWAYTYWSTDNDYVSNYSWASYYFMFEGTESGLDAHTFIHETGHQFGLEDYYSYDDVSSGYARSPLGCFDMMDNNVVDHNSYSKYALDWIDPTVGTAGATYTLKPFEEDGNCVLIADPDSYNGTAFDEYFLVEYYTPTGLNKQDATTAYNTALGTAIDTNGLRIIHVDSRIGELTYTKSTGTGHNTSSGSWTWDNNYVDTPDFTSDNVYVKISSNSKEYCYDSTSYALCALVQANGDTNLMTEGQTTAAGFSADADDLFDTDSNVFGKDIWGTSTKTDEGWTVPFNLTISAMDDTGVTFTLNSNSK